MDIFLLIVIELVNLISFIMNYMIGKQNGNLILGVTLPLERMPDKEVVQIVSEYKRVVIIVNLIIMIGTVLVFWLIPASFLMMAILVLVFLAPGVGWLLYRKYMRKLYEYKKSRDIIVGDPLEITVDTVASSMQDKQAISLWWYVIPTIISLLPVLFFFINDRFAQIIPLVGTFLPLILVGCSILTHIIMTRDSTKVISNDTRLNQLANRIYKRSWSLISFELAMLSSILFVALFCMTYLSPGSAVTSYGMLLYLIVIMGMLFFNYQSIRKRINSLLSLSEEQVVTDDDVYWIKGYYDNPYDPRIMKTNRFGTGTTMNLGNPKGRVIMAVTVILLAALILGLMGFFILVETSDFSLYRQGNTIYTEAPFYNTSFTADEIMDFRLEEKLTGDGIRVNGYGGADISLGHFRLNDYGNSLLFMYTDSPPYLVIRLEDQTVIINSRNPEKTEKMYELIKDIKGENYA